MSHWTRTRSQATPAECKSAAEPARLVLVDDQTILREGLIALTEMEGDMRVVGQAGTISDEEYARQRAQVEQTLRDLVRG